MKKLYKFYWDYSRDGVIEGLFIAEERDVKNAIGEKVYFGEVLGKYSDVYGTISKEDIEEIDISKTTLKEMEISLGGTLSGYNPLDYIQSTCWCCEHSYPEDDITWYLDKNGNKFCEFCMDNDEGEGLTKIN